MQFLAIGYIFSWFYFHSGLDCLFLRLLLCDCTLHTTLSHDKRNNDVHKTAHHRREQRRGQLSLSSSPCRNLENFTTTRASANCVCKSLTEQQWIVQVLAGRQQERTHQQPAIIGADVFIHLSYCFEALRVLLLIMYDIMHASYIWPHVNNDCLRQYMIYTLSILYTLRKSQ